MPHFGVVNSRLNRDRSPIRLEYIVVVQNEVKTKQEYMFFDFVFFYNSFFLWRKFNLGSIQNTSLNK